MFTRRGFIGLVVAALGTLVFGAADANAQSFRFLVVNNSNGALYEIRDGSGTGGRFVNQSPRNVGGLTVSGYTDRASRGEYLYILFEGSGVAEYVGFRSDNAVVNYRAYWIGLPAWAFGRTWLNPNADNVYALAKVPGCPEVRRRVPIGTR